MFKNIFEKQQLQGRKTFFGKKQGKISTNEIKKKNTHKTWVA